MSSARVSDSRETVILFAEGAQQSTAIDLSITSTTQMCFKIPQGQLIHHWHLVICEIARFWKRPARRVFVLKYSRPKQAAGLFDLSDAARGMALRTTSGLTVLSWYPSPEGRDGGDRKMATYISVFTLYVMG